jgi:hypothetical protein
MTVQRMTGFTDARLRIAGYRLPGSAKGERAWATWPDAASGLSTGQELLRASGRTVLHNNRMQLTAPLGGRDGNVGLDAAASRAFARRRRS